MKFYFIPKVDTFLELSIEHDMKSNMNAFEKVIQTVANAADGEKEVVRRALFNIHSDKEIPIQLRRSAAIQAQYGHKSEKSAKNSVEESVFVSGIPIFRIVESKFQYVYPLKAIEVCQTCHHIEGNENEDVPLGYVLGLAIAETPKSVLLENKLFFFVKDLFAVNTTLFFLMLLMIYFSTRVLAITPLNNLKKKTAFFLANNFDNDEEAKSVQLQNEIDCLEQQISELKNQIK